MKTVLAYMRMNETAKTGISVLMSVYRNEHPEYLKKALDSVYNQTLVPEEIILVQDGPVGDDLLGVIDVYRNLNKTRGKPVLKTVVMERNVMLGRALQAGLNECGYEYVARMDTDDIARPYRLQMQYDFLNEHPDISVVGGDISEFREEGIPLRRKTMPDTPEQIYEYGKYRNPINHMTVMFRKSAVTEAGGYHHFPGLEDYELWIRMLSSGYRFGNIPEILVEARTGDSFSSRRGGKEYYRRYKELRKLQHQTGYTNSVEYCISLAATFMMTRMPEGLRDKVYKRLRK